MTQPPERDSSGRFVKPPSEDAAPDNRNVHPLSRILFGWVDHPRTPNLLLLLVATAAAGLFLADLVVDRHEYLSFAEWNGFYAWWGFGAFALAVLSGWPLGYLLRRDEDYYGEADTKPQDVEEPDE
ncbi:MAG: hypothetical protein AAFO63_11495 [Pseudomonadota bacterium]